MKKIIAISCLLLSQFVFSQQVLVPYRIKDKFGLSDVKGKLVVPPQYDIINVDRNFPPGFYGFEKGSNSGVLAGTKEIINDTVYHGFRIAKNKFILADKKETVRYGRMPAAEFDELKKRSKAIALFNLKGENLYPDNFRYLKGIDTLGKSEKYKNSARFVIMRLENYDRLNSVLVYDADKQKIVKWLLTDYYRLRLEGNDYGQKEALVISARKEDGAQEERYTLTLVNNEVKLTKLEPLSGKQVGQYGAGDGSGTADYSNSPIDPGGISLPGNNKIFYTTDFTLGENNSIAMTVMANRDKQVKEIKLPYTIQSATKESIYVTLNEKGYNYMAKSAVYFKTNENKYGLILSDTIIIKPVYNEIIPIQVNVNGVNALHFLVSITDASGKVKYGTIDLKEKPVVPIVFDEIDIQFGRHTKSRQFVQSNISHLWKVVYNGKSGFINAGNHTILKPEYESITENEKINYDGFEDDFFILKKGSK